MFKSVAEFDKEVCSVLTKLRDGEKWQEKPEYLDQLDFSDVLRFISENHYVIGHTQAAQVGHFDFRIDGYPRITRAGLLFVEESLKP